MYVVWKSLTDFIWNIYFMSVLFLLRLITPNFQKRGTKVSKISVTRLILGKAKSVFWNSLSMLSLAWGQDWSTTQNKMQSTRRKESAVIVSMSLCTMISSPRMLFSILSNKRIHRGLERIPAKHYLSSPLTQPVLWRHTSCLFRTSTGFTSLI